MDFKNISVKVKSLSKYTYCITSNYLKHYLLAIEAYYTISSYKQVSPFFINLLL